MEQQTINLRQLRGKRTLKQVGEETGLNYSLISRIEQGKMPISDRTARALSRYYGVEIPTTAIKYNVEANEFKFLNKSSELRKANVALCMQISDLKEIIKGDREKYLNAIFSLETMLDSCKIKLTELVSMLNEPMVEESD